MKHVYLKTKVPVQGKDNEFCGPDCGYGGGSPDCYCFKDGGEARELVESSTPYRRPKFRRTKACLKAELKK